MTRQLSATPVGRLVAAVEGRFGVTLQKGLEAVLERAASELVKSGEASSVEEVAARLHSARASDVVVQRMQQAASVTETWFFRGRGQLEALARAATRLRRPARLRVWSAACATGEEAYSLALLFRRALPKCELSVLGTDMNEASLERAREGVYAERAFRELTPSELTDGVRRRGARWEVLPALRGLVSFARLNLVTDDYPSPAHPLHGHDVIVCRNVLIYLGARQVGAVMTKLRACAAPEAVVALTAAEHSAGAHLHGFRSTRGALFVREQDGAKAGGLPVPVPTAPARPQALAVAEPRPAEPDAGALLQKARALADAQRWAEAEAALAQAAVHAPDLAEVHLLSASMHLARDEVRPALAEARRALFLDRGLAAAELLLGQALLKTHRASEARRHLERALQLLAPLADGAPVPGLAEPASVVRAIARANLGAGR